MNTYLIHIFSLRLTESEIEKITNGKTNVVYINYDESNIDNIIEECAYFSLLNDEKIVVVKNFKINASSKPLEKYLENPNPNTKLILVVDSLDKKTVIYKKIKEKGTIIEINELKPNELSLKASNYAKSINVEIDYLALNKMLEYNNYNYDLILSDIDKIAIIKNKITLDDIEKYGSKIITEDNFALCDAITSKDYKKIPNLLTDFINNKGEVIPFIGLLASQYRIIMAVLNIKKTNDAIAKDLDIHPYRVKLAKDKASLYTKEEIENIILNLCDIDYKLKSFNVDQYTLLKLFLINL